MIGSKQQRPQGAAMRGVLVGLLFAGSALASAACSSDSERGDSAAGSGARSGNGGAGAGGLDVNNPPRPDAGGPVMRDAGMPDGSVDPGCGLACTLVETGAGTDRPFDLDENPHSGVGVDPEGALVLQRQDSEAQELIWIANTREYTVSKVDTANYEELGRYRIPSIDASRDGNENGPSRTSVDSEGNVYAGARFGWGVTKVSAAGERCPDTNGDGMITTSQGPGDVLDIGEDDCVLWSTDIDGDARGVAVQEIPASVEVEQVVDGDPIIREIPGARYVWVGGHDTVRLHKLDAETGEILFTITPPTSVYGLAMDGRGQLWIASQNQRAFGRVDTTRCVDESCADETPCVTVCSETSCPSACDDAIIERIEPRNDADEGLSSYGITVDCNQRVWLGGAWAGSGRSIGIKRYDPLADADERLRLVTTLAGAQRDGINGIAADANGWVWGAGGHTGVWRIDSDSLEFAQVTGTGGAEFQAKGIAIDRRGKVWAVPLRDSYAMVITPGATIDEATVEKPIDGFDEPYTYSDMSGEQRRLAANEPGFYRQLFEGCSEDVPTKWADLEWDIVTPMGTYVVFRARSADTVPEIDDADWTTLTVVPGRDGPLPLGPFVVTERGTMRRYLELEVQLVTTELGSQSKDGCSITSAATPRVRSFGVTHMCDPGLQ